MNIPVIISPEFQAVFVSFFRNTKSWLYPSRRAGREITTHSSYVWIYLIVIITENSLLKFTDCHFIIFKGTLTPPPSPKLVVSPSFFSKISSRFFLCCLLIFSSRITVIAWFLQRQVRLQNNLNCNIPYKKLLHTLQANRLLYTIHKNSMLLVDSTLTRNPILFPQENITHFRSDGF